ncbi:hypothetical protein G6F64_015388 [Rhizopus arrhizus]|uniref:Reverse transcriptase/retrotransposon-derived protein RNase H-like domain-containing protein n=1 Tax=Rhizopus oryzae TaxID=64495 RepID=A0A9P6WSD5_RHIOR|nr:hypothetical protein G6F64_015388 [Rhizopus arrhizus]
MLRSFLGLAGYYRSFIRKFSAIAAPLNALLKRDAPWDWTSDHQAAYATLKSALLSAPTALALLASALRSVNAIRRTIVSTL